MKIIVLGSAAGGGYPQWNCNCYNCGGLRRRTIASRPRTQSSIAISGNGSDWLLINASPDILAQIRATPALHPRRAARDTAIAAVLLMDAQVDHVTGLMMLREGPAIPLYCSEPVWQDLQTGYPLTRVLEHYCGVEWHPLPIEHGDPRPFHIPKIDGLRLTAVPLASKAPPYSPHRDRPVAGDNIGLLVQDEASGKTLFYAPGLGRIDPLVEAAMREADCLMVDGTFWSEDEMQRHGFSDKPAAAMGHLPQSGPGGMMEVLGRMPAERKILIHINNTNPILDEHSVQHATLRARGIEVAHDNLELEL